MELRGRNWSGLRRRSIRVVLFADLRIGWMDALQGINIMFLGARYLGSSISSCFTG